MFQIIKQILILHKDNPSKHKIQFLKDIRTFMALCDKVIAPLLLNHEFTVVNHIFWKAEFNFTSHTQAWLLPGLLNQEIT